MLSNPILDRKKGRNGTGQNRTKRDGDKTGRNGTGTKQDETERRQMTEEQEGELSDVKTAAELAVKNYLSIILKNGLYQDL